MPTSKLKKLEPHIHLKRHDDEDDEIEMVYSKDGHYVKFSDAEALELQVHKLELQLKYLRNVQKYQKKAIKILISYFKGIPRRSCQRKDREQHRLG